MNKEGKRGLNMAFPPWENVLIDQTYGFLERENTPFQSSINGDEETYISSVGEASPDDIVIGSLLQASAMGFDDLSNHTLYEALEREDPPFPIPSINGDEETHFSIGEEKEKIMDENGSLLQLLQHQSQGLLISPSEAEGSNAKKKEHNAKERERRMKLTQTYLSLRSLLPNSRRSKKRWSSTRIIDKVLDYIPTLEEEIEKLKQKKEKLQKPTDRKNNSNQRETVGENQPLECDLLLLPSVSIQKLTKEELIIQICMKQRGTMFSSLIHKAEAEGMRIVGASTVYVSRDDRRTIITCHLHIQMNRRSSQEAADIESILKEKVISWFQY